MSAMTPAQIDGVLVSAEEQIGTQGTADLRVLGFWKIVGAVKRDPALVDSSADRIGAIDQAVFPAWAPLTIPILAGTVVAGLATFLGLGPGEVPKRDDIRFVVGTGSCSWLSRLLTC
jgi:hypothetical protein